MFAVCHPLHIHWNSGTIFQTGREHRVLLSKHEPNHFPSRQYMTKQIYDELQTTRYLTLLLSVMLTSVQCKKQADWDAIAERIHLAGGSGAPLLLRTKAYYADLASKDVER